MVTRTRTTARSAGTKKRERGGASFPCPGCGAPTHVLDTRRGLLDDEVRRLRQCLKNKQHTVMTVEHDAAKSYQAPS
jgi:hypothetical protein